jgi:hypothetical protein
MFVSIKKKVLLPAFHYKMEQNKQKSLVAWSGQINIEWFPKGFGSNHNC